MITSGDHAVPGIKPGLAQASLTLYNFSSCLLFFIQKIKKMSAGGVAQSDRIYAFTCETPSLIPGSTLLL